MEYLEGMIVIEGLPPPLQLNSLVSRYTWLERDTERVKCSTLFFFYKNIFYKNIEAEILKRIDIILCVETFLNTIQFYVFSLTV